MVKTSSKIAVAMSGGVDSSVAAALLQEQGHDVFGLTMQLVPESDSAIEDARRVAAFLDIPHYAVDLRDVFSHEIIDYFCREYADGRTPNPCVLCNRLMKFGALWDVATGLGADFIATGHYARAERAGAATFLKKGLDGKKDQSYFLCRLTQEQLNRTLFPVGCLTKTEVRRLARERGLPSAARPESQEICFVADHDHAAFVARYMEQSSAPGPILDGRGNVLGEHRGITSYTIGQRHGLGVAAAAPLYVTAIRPDRNAVIVGVKQDTLASALIAAGVSWINGGMPAPGTAIQAKVRHHHPEAPVALSPLDDSRILVRFETPQMAVAPGQTIAFYDGDRVIGGGTIWKQGEIL
jgi:tRNA-specific 2-thiouridylase